MKIVFVYPRWNYPTFGQLQEPLGIMSVAATLKQAGHEVLAFDLAVNPIEEVDEAIKDADLAGISSSTVLYGRARAVKDRIKEQRPGLPVVIGGPHATVRPEETLEHGFDAAVIGEGETSSLALAEAVEKGKPLHEVPGVAALKNGEFSRGPERQFVDDLDSLPDPDRSLFDYELYKSANMTNVGLMATRGCPWNCLFCKPMQDMLFGRKIRKRSAGRVAAEMARVQEITGLARYLFKDDTLVMTGVEWFDDLERRLRERGLSHASWSCQARVDQIGRSLIERMKRCGLEGVAFGVESGSQKVLDFYRKGITPEQTIQAFDICHELGVGTHAFIMLGAPMETREDLEATIRLVERIKTESISVSVATPSPGSALFEKISEMGLMNLRDPEDSDYHFNRDPIRLEHLTHKDLAWAENKILDLVPGTYFMDQLRKRQDMLGGEPEASAG